MPDRHLAQMFFDRCSRPISVPMFRTKDKHGVYQDVDWKFAQTKVEELAAGFLTVLDVKAGDNVAIFANTSLDWIVADYALLSLGVKTVPVYASLLPPEVGYIHSDTQAVATVVEDKERLQTWRTIKKGFTFFEKEYGPETVPSAKAIVINPDGLEPADDWISLDDVQKRGNGALAETEDERKRRMAAIERDHVATYCYTSGTTGPPKGVIQTHDNLLSLLENVADTGIFDERAREAGSFLFLPLAHAFGRLMQFGATFYEAPLVISSIETLADDLAKSRPAFLPGAPRMYEKMYSKITSAVDAAPPHRQALFRWALDVGKRRIPYWQRGKAMPFGLSFQYKLADKLVWSKVRARLGMDRMLAMLSGSAPLPLEVQEFFAAAGVIILEAYGLTETCPGLTTNKLHKWKMGTVGERIIGVELRIADDGEILAKGPNVVSGYLNRPEATAEAFDDDGWFHTGDIGEIDDEGFLTITDRKKDLLKTSGGKYVAPQKVEALLKIKPLLSEAVMIGDGKNYCVAILVADKEALEDWCQRNAAKPQADDAKVVAELQKYVDDVNAELASFETVKYFHFTTEEFSVENGLLTASLKVKRKEVAKQFADEIAAMYENKK